MARKAAVVAAAAKSETLLQSYRQSCWAASSAVAGRLRGCANRARRAECCALWSQELAEACWFYCIIVLRF